MVISARSTLAFETSAWFYFQLHGDSFLSLCYDDEVISLLTRFLSEQADCVGDAPLAPTHLTSVIGRSLYLYLYLCFVVLLLCF
jgi:hypothetical protein